MSEVWNLIRFLKRNQESDTCKAGLAVSFCDRSPGTPPKTNMTGWKIHHGLFESMYFLLKMRIFQPVILVFRSVLLRLSWLLVLVSLKNTQGQSHGSRLAASRGSFSSCWATKPVSPTGGFASPVDAGHRVEGRWEKMKDVSWLYGLQSF